MGRLAAARVYLHSADDCKPVPFACPLPSPSAEPSRALPSQPESDVSYLKSGPTHIEHVTKVVCVGHTVTRAQCNASSRIGTHEGNVRSYIILSRARRSARVQLGIFSLMHILCWR